MRTFGAVGAGVGSLIWICSPLMIFVAAGGGEAAGVNDAPYKSAFAGTAPGDTAATRGCSGEEVEHSSVAGVTAPPTGPEQTSPPMPADGRLTFRFATFDDERFWGDELQLHRAIAGAKLGGSGRGLTPTAALALGLKVDVDALPAELIEKLSKSVDLDNPAVTADLLKLDAVVGVKGFLTKDGKLSSVGITCAACHSTVDDSLRLAWDTGGTAGPIATWTSARSSVWLPT